MDTRRVGEDERHEYSFGAARGIPALIAHGPPSDDRPAALLFPGAEQHFANVFVDDVAAFYVLALERAPAGSYFLIANPDAPRISEIAQAASRGRGLDGRVTPEPETDTRARLGPLTDAILLDEEVDCTHAMQLGWTPTGPALLQELEHGSYSDTYEDPETSS